MKSQQTDPQLLDQMKRINERLYMLERKMDVLANLIKPNSAQVKVAPPKAPQLQQQTSPINPSQIYNPPNNHNNHNNHNHQNHRPKERQMYQTICADCQKECEVPFKPTGDRPIYCKECFTRRRNGQGNKSNIPNAPTPTHTPAPAAAKQAPKTKTPAAAKAKKKAPAAKKPAAKKPAAKKKR